MGWAVTKEDLKVHQTRNPNLIFCIGTPHSGITTQLTKIKNELKYGVIDMNVLFEESKSKLQGEPTSLDIIAVLLQNINVQKEKNILIRNFPRSIEEAKVFEKEIGEIKKILCFETTYEISENRAVDIAKKGGIELDKATFKKEFDDKTALLNELNNYFGPFSIISKINSSQNIQDTFNQAKQSLYPVLYSIIGKRYSGKTELGNVLKNKIKINTIDFEEFLLEPSIVKRRTENEFVTQAFINKLRNMQDVRVLIENFPKNKEQYSYFVNNCKGFQRIYYLNVENSVALERQNQINIDDKNYTDCSELTRMLRDFDKNIGFIDFLKKKANVLEVNVNEHKILTIQHFLKQVQPFWVIVKAWDEARAAQSETWKNKLVNEFGFVRIQDVTTSFERFKQITGEPGTLSQNNVIKVLLPLLIREDCSKFIIDLPYKFTKELFATFEKDWFEIGKELCFASFPMSWEDNDTAIEFDLQKRHKIFFFNPDQELTNYSVQESLDMTRDINVIYGLPNTGKTIMAKHWAGKYNFTLLDFKDWTEQVKKTKIDPENPDAEPEINFQDLVQGWKNYLAVSPWNKKIIIDNFFIPVAAEGFLIDTYDKALEILNTIGQFRTLYRTQIDEKKLLERYKAKEGIAEEMTEEQWGAFNESWEKPKWLLQRLQEISYYKVDINTEESEQRSKMNYDYSHGRNIIVVKHEYDINIERTLEVFAFNNKMLYINVPKWIYKHFYNNDPFSAKLEENYGRRVLTKSCSDENSKDEVIYFKYNPVHFNQSWINEMILNYANLHGAEIEDYGNYIILSGYLNNDLLAETDLPFNLPLLEVKKIMEMGDWTQLIQITRKEIKDFEDEEPVELVVEKKKKEVKKDPLDVDGGENNEEKPPEEEEPQEENQEGAPKFKPEGLKWTNYDGVPRNYIQVLKRLKMYPLDKWVAHKDNIKSELYGALGKHYAMYKERNTNDYRGNITVFNYAG